MRGLCQENFAKNIACRLPSSKLVKSFLVQVVVAIIVVAVVAVVAAAAAVVVVHPNSL